MKYVERECDVTELEKDVKNKWRWAWLSEKNDTGVKFEEWCQKVAVAGTCYCVPCGKTLLYANRGKKALSSHADDPQHVANHKSIRQTCTLDGATKTTSTKSSVSEGTAELKTVVCSFLAEHCLSLSLSQALVDLTKRLSADKVALSALSLGRTCATYTMTYMGMWQVHAVSSILKNPLLSIYPQFAGHNVRCHLNTLVVPRSAAYMPKNPTPGIMWSHIHGKKAPEISWRPNHFVVCLPGETSKTKCQKQAPTKLGKRKSISGEDDIRSFFTKCKKMD
eukprot:TRINITY_DN1076_c0_g1_i2.p1 TRINITY_DN1076_c0_g1~~TRINITY_DN1076_c0_g1_i2.p1  ORF type:complete len:279 (-),score=36.63 TRINITY_DN1076_c0_g1_i2:635-1471(-)